MKQAIFTNKIFIVLLIALLITLLMYNCFTLVTTGDSVAFIPIAIGIILLILILTKSPYTKIAIIIWATVSSILGFGLKFIADLLDDLNGNFKPYSIATFFINLFGLVIGILVIYFTLKKVSIISSDEKLGK